MSLTDHTTAHLVGDIERLREHLGIETWIVNGVSWGSTLALAYAQAHPDRVLGIVLFAVTTTSRREVDWITEGVGMMFPEAWDRFASHAESAGIGYQRGHGRLVEAYSRLMESADPVLREAASQEWALWEDTHTSIGVGGFRRDPRWEDERFRHAFLRLTAHYWSHDGFCDPPILELMDRLRGIPGVLIHGRKDISSPLPTAWELRRRWPGSALMTMRATAMEARRSSTAGGTQTTSSLLLPVPSAPTAHRHDRALYLQKSGQGCPLWHHGAGRR